jgi:hypothetical protein
LGLIASLREQFHFRYYLTNLEFFTQNFKFLFDRLLDGH